MRIKKDMKYAAIKFVNEVIEKVMLAQGMRIHRYTPGAARVVDREAGLLSNRMQQEYEEMPAPWFPAFEREQELLDEDLYYVQPLGFNENGNAVWWKAKGKGTTEDLDEAYKFTLSEVPPDGVDTTRSWRASWIDNHHAKRVVRMEDLGKWYD